jgi:hypothetical protein
LKNYEFDLYLKRYSHINEACEYNPHLEKTPGAPDTPTTPVVTNTTTPTTPVVKPATNSTTALIA